MNRNAIVFYSVLATLGCANLAYVENAGATNMMNMFNPSRWFSGNNDRRYYDDDYYYYDRPYGYRYGGPGWGYGPGWGGYGYGPYGYGMPGYGAQQTQPAPEKIPE